MNTLLELIAALEKEEFASVNFYTLIDAIIFQRKIIIEEMEEC